MEFHPKLYDRRSIRLQGYDYARPGQYFVTVCAHQREALFGEVVGGQMQRNALGDIVHKEWFATERIRPQTRLDAFIVMPNHTHAIIEIITEGTTHRVVPTTTGETDNRHLRTTHRVGAGRPRGPAPGSIGAIVGQIKSLTKKAINKTTGTPGRLVWQPNYHEHIIRNEEELHRIREYICNNPLRWPSDRENPACQGDTLDEIADIVLWGDAPWDES